MVELRKVSKRFGSFTALEEVSFDIAEGEFMTFLGPSGCGKTTCLRLISGFETPSTGEIFIGGKNVTHDPPYRRDVNQVFQSYALFPHLSVYENISFGLRMKKLAAPEIKKRVDRVVEMTSLHEFASRKPAQLSGGPAPAGGLGAGDRLRTEGPSPGRTAQRSRRQVAHSDALGTQATPETARHYVYFRHPRSGGGSHDERSRRGDQFADASNKSALSTKSITNPRRRFVATFIGETNIVEAEVSTTARRTCSIAASRVA